jgi:crotonobetainyl-CoA:carnitine CoA-transferase CaiB-like acyl-CoA transferase
VAQALDDPLTAARGLRIEVDGVPMLGSALQLSETPVAYRSGPPALGQHDEAVVRALGFDAAALRASGVLRDRIAAVPA